MSARQQKREKKKGCEENKAIVVLVNTIYESGIRLKDNEIVVDILTLLVAGYNASASTAIRILLARFSTTRR